MRYSQVRIKGHRFAVNRYFAMKGGDFYTADVLGNDGAWHQIGGTSFDYPADADLAIREYAEDLRPWPADPLEKRYV